MLRDNRDLVFYISGVVCGVIGGLLVFSGSCKAEPVNYFDKNGQLFMQSNRVGNQVIYTDGRGNLVATQNPVATPVFPPLTPNLAPPRGILVSTELPQLPVLGEFK